MDTRFFECAEIVAFDFFDTLVHRKYNPEKVLLIWAKKVREQLNIRCSNGEIYIFRKDSEIELRKAGFKDVPYNKIIKKLYSKLIGQGYLRPVEFSEFEFVCRQMEYKCEVENTFIDEKNVSIAKALLQLGKKLVIISDFYLGKEFLMYLCNVHGIAELFRKCYVSSDYCARKSTGELYKIVLTDNHVKPDRMIMIGDNPFSDQKIPKKMGIQIYPVDSYSYDYFVTNKIEMKRIVKHICRDGNLFSGYASILFLFIAELHKEALRGGCNRILFCSREGQILKKLFDRYQEICVPGRFIESKYFYISRRATFLASLKRCENEGFQRMFLNYKSLNIDDFLYNLGFDKSESAQLIQNTGVSKECMAMTRGVSHEFDQFLENPVFIQAYERKRKNVKQLVKDYVDQVNGHSKIWMVDIGWRGTIQDNLYSSLDQCTEITGLYFGLIDAERCSHNNKIGIIFDDKKDAANFQLMSFDHIDLEKICSADHGPVTGYYKKESRVCPVIVEKEDELAIYQYVKEEQDILLNTFAQMCHCFNNSIYGCEDMSLVLKSEYLFHLCVNQPEHYRYYYNYRNIVVENFGAKTTKVTNSFTFKGYSEQFCWGMVNYVFRSLDKVHMKCLYPVGRLYCKLIYRLKRRRLR